MVAQSVDIGLLILAQVMISQFVCLSPVLSSGSVEPALDSLSPSLCPSCSPSLSLSLSQSK